MSTPSMACALLAGPDAELCGNFGRLIPECGSNVHDDYVTHRLPPEREQPWLDVSRKTPSYKTRGQ